MSALEGGFRPDADVVRDTKYPESRSSRTSVFTQSGPDADVVRDTEFRGNAPRGPAFSHSLDPKRTFAQNSDSPANFQPAFFLTPLGTAGPRASISRCSCQFNCKAVPFKKWLENGRVTNADRYVRFQSCSSEKWDRFPVIIKHYKA